MQPKQRKKGTKQKTIVLNTLNKTKHKQDEFGFALVKTLLGAEGHLNIG